MIQTFADWLTRDIFSIASGTHLYDAVNFFIYDTLKIFLLLAVIIFPISTLRTFLPREKVKNILSGRKGYLGNILASLYITSGLIIAIFSGIIIGKSLVAVMNISHQLALRQMAI